MSIRLKSCPKGAGPIGCEVRKGMESRSSLRTGASVAMPGRERPTAPFSRACFSFGTNAAILILCLTPVHQSYSQVTGGAILAVILLDTTNSMNDSVTLAQPEAGYLQRDFWISAEAHDCDAKPAENIVLR